MQLLPHRFPLLLVDRVIDCVPGKHISGVKNITNGDALFVSSIARERVMPHLLVIEALAQLSVILAFKTLELHPTGNELMFFAGIDNANFGKVALPGERLVLRSQLHRIRRLVGWFHAQAEVEGHFVIEVSMLAAIKGGQRGNNAM